MIKNWIRRNIFFIDGVGALVTVFMLGVVLPYLKLGIPKEVLLSLAMLASVYGFYSISCYILKKDTSSKWLKIIIAANLIYCVLTFVIVLYFFTELSLLGFVYFFGEIGIILALCIIETRVFAKSF